MRMRNARHAPAGGCLSGGPDGHDSPRLREKEREREREREREKETLSRVKGGTKLSLCPPCNNPRACARGPGALHVIGSHLTR